MRKPRIPSAQHLARICHDDVAAVTAELRAIGNRRFVFGYETSRRLYRALRSANISLDSAVKQCSREHSDVGRKQNEDVVRLIHSYTFDGAAYLCHRITDDIYPIGQGYFVPIPGLYYFIRDGQPVVAILQPWKNLYMDTNRLAVWATILDRAVFVDDFETAGLELLDLSAPESSDKRTIKVWDRSNLPILSDRELSDRLEVFIDAYEAVLSEYEEFRKGAGEAPRAPKPAPLLDLIKQ